MTTTSAAATLAYAIDPTHSSVQFSVRHMMVSKVRGTFNTLAGSVTVPAGSAIPVAITAQIDVASIDTRDAQRDGHLMSPDFLDAQTYPTLNFNSSSIESVDATHFRVVGELELHGTNKPVTLSVEATGHGKDMYGIERIGYEATAKISRKEFGLVWNQALETGGVAVGDEVTITLDIEAVPTAA